MAYTKRVRRILKACFKRQIELTSSGWSRTNENAEYRAILDRCWSDGKIGVAVSGMDCDCSSYARQYTIDVPNSVPHLKRWFDEHNEWLDGPESLSFIHPDAVDASQNYSRDLALEAFEDGHPHVVYA